MIAGMKRPQKLLIFHTQRTLYNRVSANANADLRGGLKFLPCANNQKARIDSSR